MRVKEMTAKTLEGFIGSEIKYTETTRSGQQVRRAVLVSVTERPEFPGKDLAAFEVSENHIIRGYTNQVVEVYS